MTAILGSCDCGDKPISLHSEAINDVLRQRARDLIPEGEMAWWATYVLKVPPTTLSSYLNGTRAFPAWAVVALDRAFRKRVLLDVLVDAEAGHDLERPVDPRTIKTLFALALREEGAFNARLVDALADDIVDADEAENLDRSICRLQRFLDAMRERLAEAKECRQGRRA